VDLKNFCALYIYVCAPQTLSRFKNLQDLESQCLDFNDFHIS